jgi:hypothetical protein
MLFSDRRKAMHVVGDAFVFKNLKMMRMHLGYFHATQDDPLAELL